MTRALTRNNYFFIDGPALLGDVSRYRRKQQSTFRLSLVQFVKHFTRDQLEKYHGLSFRRFVFYFVQSDERLQSHVLLPDLTLPAHAEDTRIEYCGRRIKEDIKAREWLEKRSAPQYVLDRLYRSEKAVDTQICCDALQLAALKQLDRLFLYTNDYDFVPLCRTMRGLGININLIRLFQERVNKDLVAECDAFDIAVPGSLKRLFVE